MYIIAIGWLYVVLMMALTSKSVAAGVFFFLAWGLAPLAVLLWLSERASRLRRVSGKVADQPVHPQNGADPEGDQ